MYSGQFETVRSPLGGGSYLTAVTSADSPPPSMPPPPPPQAARAIATANAPPAAANPRNLLLLVTGFLLSGSVQAGSATSGGLVPLPADSFTTCMWSGLQ